MCMGGGSSDIQETSDQRAQQQINQKLWSYYKSDYEPMIQKYSERVSSPDTQEAERKQVAGQIQGEVMKNVDPSKVSSNPVQNTKTLAGLSKLATGAQMQGQGGVKSRQIGEMQNIIDIGRGQATTAQIGLGELAGESIKSEISNQELEQMRQSAVENAVGSVAGAIGAGALKYGSGAAKPRTITYHPDMGAQY